MMMPVPNPVRLSAHPYLLAAVLHAAIVNHRDPGLLSQKAHRLINKHSYKHETLDRTAQVAFGTEYFDYTGITPSYYEMALPFISCLEVVVNDSTVHMEALDNRDAAFGNLRDFINHCLSGDE